MQRRSRALTLIPALLVAVAFAPATSVRADTTASRPIDTAASRPIDPATSKASFSVRHVFVEHVTGTVPISSGTVVLAPDSAIPVSIAAELEPAKVDSGDRDRDGALVSPDFFDVKDFPAWTFASTKITPLGPSSFGIDGTLTIHGVAQNEHLDVTVKGTAAHPLYHAVGHIDRHAFKMPITRLDPAIGEIVDITLDIDLK